MLIWPVDLGLAGSLSHRDEGPPPKAAMFPAGARAQSLWRGVALTGRIQMQVSSSAAHSDESYSDTWRRLENDVSDLSESCNMGGFISDSWGS